MAPGARSVVASAKPVPTTSVDDSNQPRKRKKGSALDLSNTTSDSDINESHNIKDFLDILQLHLNRQTASMESMKSEIIQKLDDAVCAQNKTIEHLSQSVKSLDERVQQIENTGGNVQQEIESLHHLLEMQEIEVRKSRLVFVGFDENDDNKEPSIMKRIIDFCKDQLKIEIQLDSAFRFGRPDHNGLRKIKARFVSLSQRDAVFVARDILRKNRIPVFINEDLPFVTTQRRRMLRAECSKAIAMGKEARLRGDQLWINNSAYCIDKTDRLVPWRPAFSPYQRALSRGRPSSHANASRPGPVRQSVNMATTHASTSTSRPFRQRSTYGNSTQNHPQENTATFNFAFEGNSSFTATPESSSTIPFTSMTSTQQSPDEMDHNQISANVN